MQFSFEWEVANKHKEMKNEHNKKNDRRKLIDKENTFALMGLFRMNPSVKKQLPD